MVYFALACMRRRHWYTCFCLVFVRMRISCLESSIKVEIYHVCTVCALVQLVDTWYSSFVSSRENRAFEDYKKASHLVVVISRVCAEFAPYFACFLMKRQFFTVLCVFRLLLAELSRLFCTLYEVHELFYAFCDVAMRF